MKIVTLVAENVKRLKAVEIRPDSHVVEITGRNGQGKTSVLDAIWWALAGSKSIQDQPINRDADHARIKLDLGELVITRTFKREKDGPGYTTSISVENAEGARFPSPQHMLDGLLSTLAFDPLEFSRMNPADQYEALKRFVPDVDFDAIERQQKGDFAMRTETNRRAREAMAAAAAVLIPAGTPDEPVDEAKLVADLEAAVRGNAEIEAEKGRRTSAWERAQSFRREAQRLTEEADEIEARLKGLSEPERVDIASIRAEVDRARATNVAVRQKAERKKHEQVAVAAEKEADDLTARMEARERAKCEAIAAARMPVAGLDFGDGVVLKNGLPFDQASDAEKLRDSVAIAMASNPKLRVLRIRDASLLDGASMQMLREMAAAADFQVWCEVVDDSGKVGFVIEDGEVAHVEGS